MSPRRIADAVGHGPVPQSRVLAALPLVPGHRVRVLEPRGAKQADGFVDHGGPRRHPEPARVLVEKRDIVAGQAHTDLHTIILLNLPLNLPPGPRAPPGAIGRSGGTGPNRARVPRPGRVARGRPRRWGASPTAASSGRP